MQTWSETRVFTQNTAINTLHYTIIPVYRTSPYLGQISWVSQVHLALLVNSVFPLGNAKHTVMVITIFTVY
jgi:hypothetical protein